MLTCVDKGDRMKLSSMLVFYAVLLAVILLVVAGRTLRNDGRLIGFDERRGA